MHRTLTKARSLLLFALGVYACESTSLPDGDDDGGSTPGAAEGGASGNGGATWGGTAGVARGGAPARGGSMSGGNGGEEVTGGAPGGAGQSNSGAHAGDSSGGSAGTGAGSSSAGVGTISGGAWSGVGGSDGLAGGGSGGVPDVADPNVTWLGPCTPRDLSADGQTALALEGVWNQASGWTRLPYLRAGDDRNEPVVLSADGRAVFGCSGSATTGCELYRWTREDGIRGLGRSYAGSSRYGDSLGTNADGSTLVACGYDGTVDDNPALLRWTLNDSFQIVDTSQILYPDRSACASGSATLSSNGRTIAADYRITVEPDGLGGVFTLQNRPPLPGESTTVTQLYHYFNNARSLVVTAISGDGSVVAVYQNGDSTVKACLVDWNCSNERNVLEDLSYDGSSGTGRILSVNGPVMPVAPIYWSQAGGLRYVSDVLAERGAIVDPPPLPSLSISEDSRALLGVSTRHKSDGSAFEECFIATFGEPLTSDPLPALNAGCGNGLADPGEACDDGNLNNSDACTSRCQRVALVAGFSSTCAIHHGRVECWGPNANITGAQEVSRGWSPIEIASTDGATQLAIGTDHACVTLEGGTVRCWGANALGELGDGSTNASDTPVDVLGLNGVAQVGAGWRYSCALLVNGSVRCWGNNDSGQLGDGTLVNSPVPVVVSNLSNAVQISASASGGATCALLSDATVSCWGELDYIATPVPAPVVGLSNVREITMLFDFSYALLLDETLVTWIGLSPIGVSSVLPANTKQVAGSDLSGFMCYLGDGTIGCYGDNTFGVLGTGDRSRGGAVAGIRNAVLIAAGENGHACALLATGEVRCWGNNTTGLLGNGTIKTNVPIGIPTPVAVKGFP